MRESQKDQEGKSVQLKQTVLISGDLRMEERHSLKQGIQMAVWCRSHNATSKGSGVTEENSKPLAFTTCDQNDPSSPTFRENIFPTKIKSIWR